MSINNPLIINIDRLSKDIIEPLLIDRTERRNIIWATSDYTDLGPFFQPGQQIHYELITGAYSQVILPRVLKAHEQRQVRTRDKAEVFTPSWVCNEQNNMVDAQWFGRLNVFNQSGNKTWKTTDEKIKFDEKGSHTWKQYVDVKRLEVTCGEAPYLVSRYDSVTGEIIPIKERIGLLDRKLRVVTENTESKKDWKCWARRAVESIYGYEYQGDNLLLARLNIFYSYIEYYQYRFKEDPPLLEQVAIAKVISWNLWQMDGLNYAIPLCKGLDEPYQTVLSEYIDDLTEAEIAYLSDPKGQPFCRIKDWRGNKTIEYRKIVEAK